MKEGKVVLTILPQDGSQKLRPVLILKILPKYNDFLICAISSQIHQYIPNFDLLLDNSNLDFQSSGLQKASVIRLSNLAVIGNNQIAGAIGNISEKSHAALLKNLADFLLT